MMPPAGYEENQSNKRAAEAEEEWQETPAAWFWPGSRAAALTSGAAATTSTTPRLKLKTKNITDVRLLLLSLLNGELGLIFFLLSHVITPFLLIVVIS